MTERTMYDVEPEMAVLNIILLNPELVYTLQNLRPFMFSSTPAQTIYEAILEVVERNNVPEFNLIVNYLKSKGAFAQAGGEEYLNYIRNQPFDKENLGEYERQVIQNYKRRSLIQVTSSVARSDFSSQDVDSVLSSLRSSLDNLENTSGGDTTVSMQVALPDVWDSIVHRVENPGLVGVSTGISDLDANTGGVSGGDVWIIASRPSMGKSATMCDSMLATAKAGNGVLAFSLEMNKNQLIERMISMETGVSVSDLRLGILNQRQLNLVQETIRSFRNLPIYIDCNYAVSLNYIVNTIRKYKRQHDIKLVFIDYIQLLADRDENQTAELGRISRAMKLLANELGIGIIILSQLNRNVELREDKRPVLADLRQSGNLEEDADIVIMLYRDEKYNPNTKDKGMIEFLIRKHRSGPTGTIVLRFDEKTNKITSD